MVLMHKRLKYYYKGNTCVHIIIRLIVIIMIRQITRQSHISSRLKETDKLKFVLLTIDLIPLSHSLFDTNKMMGRNIMAGEHTVNPSLI